MPPVSGATTGMVGRTGADHCVTDDDLAPRIELQNGDVCLQVITGNRKVRIDHLVQNRHRLVPVETGREQPDLPALLVDRTKKRQPLDMIPVMVTEKQCQRCIAVCQPVTKPANPRAGVDDELGAIIELDMQTGCIAAIPDRVDARRCDGTTHSVESCSHASIPG